MQHFLAAHAEMAAAIQPALDAGIKQVLQDAGSIGYPVMQAATPVRSGALQASETMTIDGPKLSLLAGGDTAPYAPFVEWDTMPHDIYPRKARVLHWTDGSGEHFAMHVHHPGTKGKKMVWQGAEAAKQWIRQHATETVAEHLRPAIRAAQGA